MRTAEPFEPFVFLINMYCKRVLSAEMFRTLFAPVLLFFSVDSQMIEEIMESSKISAMCLQFAKTLRMEALHDSQPFSCARPFESVYFEVEKGLFKVLRALCLYLYIAKVAELVPHFDHHIVFNFGEKRALMPKLIGGF